MGAGHQRLWEVDAVRGVAILMMLASNALFDLFLFGGCAWCSAGWWLVFARATAGLFLLLVGMSLTLSYSRLRGSRGAFSKYVKRGTKIAGYGMLVTAASWLVVPGQVIFFGILHLIGVSIILAYPFLQRPAAAFAGGAVVIGTGFLAGGLSVPFPWLLWLGPVPAGYAAADHTPLLPWFGVVLLGIGLGQALFPAGARRSRPADRSGKAVQFLAMLGRRSLLIYLVHQPVLLAGLVLLGAVAL